MSGPRVPHPSTISHQSTTPKRMSRYTSPRALRLLLYLCPPQTSSGRPRQTTPDRARPSRNQNGTYLWKFDRPCDANACKVRRHAHRSVDRGADKASNHVHVLEPASPSSSAVPTMPTKSNPAAKYPRGQARGTKETRESSTQTSKHPNTQPDPADPASWQAKLVQAR